MNMPRLLPRRWRNRAEDERHAEAIADVLRTPPIIARNDGLVIFSMIGTATLLPYLVAVKSLWAELGRGRIAILDDGTLTAQDRAILAHHCGDPEIIAIAAVKLAGLPTSRVWTRLFTMLDRRRAEYWIHLDCNTVTIASVPELVQAVARNRSFLLPAGQDADKTVLPLDEYTAQTYPDGPVDGEALAAIESRLDQLGHTDWRYIRGNPALLGFAAGGTGQRFAGAFLDHLKRLLGEEVIHASGAEQAVASFQIANDRDAVLLPCERYCDYRARPWGPQVAFLNFAGDLRHLDDAYAAVSRKVIEKLTS